MSNGISDVVTRVKVLYTQEFTRKSAGEMRALLEQALTETGEREPQAAAEARALLAGVMACQHLNNWTAEGEAQLAAAERHIEDALRTTSGPAPLVHFAAGFLHRARGRHEPALAAFRRALEHSSNFAGAHAQTGAELLYLGRPQEALPHIERAIELAADGPLRSMFYWIMGRTRFFLAEYEDAIPWFEKSITIQKDLWYTRLYLVSANALAGRRSEAERVLNEFHSLFPPHTLARVIEAERRIPHDNLFVVVGRRNFHAGLRLAGMT